MRKINFETLKVGDTVHSATMGEIEIVRIKTKDFTYPIRGKTFNGEEHEFTVDGKLYETDLHPNLYLDPIVFGFQERVMMVSDDKIKWFPRVIFHIKEVAGQPYYFAWFNKETIEESKNTYDPIHWKYAKEVEPVEPTITITLDLTKGQIEQLKSQGIIIK